MVRYFLIASILITSNAFAGIITIPCTDCTEVQMGRAAEISMRRDGSKYFVIMDYMNKTARKYQVFKSTSSNGEPITNTYLQAMTSEEIHDADIIFEYRRVIVDMLKEAESKVPYGLDSNINTNMVSAKSSTASAASRTAYYSVGSIKVKGSPLDFVTTSRFRNNIYDYYVAGHSGQLAQIISGTFNKIDIPLMKNSDIKLEIVFVDVVDGVAVTNGRGVITIDFDYESLDVLVLKDKDNNSVPTAAAAAPGTYSFATESSYDAFSAFLTTTFVSGGSGCTVTMVQSTDGRHVFTYVC